MNTNRTRNLIRQDRLEKFGKILFNKRDLKLKLSVGSSTNLACCDSTSKVWVNNNVHQDVVTNLILQKALTLHEMGHIGYTNSAVWRKSPVPKRLSNIIEDGRVEEAVSRKYPKARLYFIFANRMFLALKEDQKNLDNANLENLLLQLVLRESMKKTGVPQLPKYVHEFLLRKIGSDYHWLLAKTREAINAKKEKDCEPIVLKIDMKIKELLKKDSRENYSKSATSSREDSLTNSGGVARQMPEEIEDSLADLLENQETEVSDEQMPEPMPEVETSDSEEQDLTKPGSVDGSLSDPEDLQDSSTTDEVGNDVGASDDDTEDDDTVHEDTDSPDDTNEIENVLQSQLESIMRQVEDSVTQDAVSEIKTENDIIKSGEADTDFSDYDVNQDKDFRSFERRYNKLIKPINTQLLEPHANRIAHQFRTIAQFGDGWKHSQTRGKLETHRLPTMYTSNNPKMFKRRDKVQGVDLSVSILLDASLSMARRAEEATNVTYIIARALEIGKYNSEVVQFGVTGDNTYGTHVIYGLKSFRQSLHYAKKRFVPSARGFTPMLAALEGSEKSLGKQKSLRKICFVVTDGYPCTMECSSDIYQEKCRNKIKDMEKQGITVIGVLIRTDDKRKIFQDGFKFKCENVSDVEKEMVNVLKRVIQSLKK